LIQVFSEKPKTGSLRYLAFARRRRKITRDPTMRLAGIQQSVEKCPPGIFQPRQAASRPAIAGFAGYFARFQTQAWATAMGRDATSGVVK
jgi:hypothetical protein